MLTWLLISIGCLVVGTGGVVKHKTAKKKQQQEVSRSSTTVTTDGFECEQIGENELRCTR